MSLLIVDMDGMLRGLLSGHFYSQDPHEQPLIGAVGMAIQAYQGNWTVVGISNQTGVATGCQTLQECIQEQQHTLQLIPQLAEIYFCPDFEGRRCFRVTRHSASNHSQTRWFRQYRKPQPGMLKLAMVRHNHFPENCLYVGDHPEDQESARRAGVAFQWTWEWIARCQLETALQI